MKSFRIKNTTYVDRAHMTYEFLNILFKYNIQIYNMEIYSCEGYYILPEVEKETWDKVVEDLKKIDGMKSVEEVSILPFELKEIEMKKVLDLVPQGIILLDPQGKIRYINKKVSNDILTSNSDNMINKSIYEFVFDDALSNLIADNVKTGSTKHKKILIDNRYYKAKIENITVKDDIFSGYLLTLDDVVDHDLYYNPINFDDIIGESKKIHDIINEAKLYSKSDSPILITGESGTGKEIFARGIHNLSDRNSKPFIAINCAAIPEQLLESELFGYESGSFTGGKKEGNKGLLEVGEGGTIFLDEIGDMPFLLQTKLLRVLQEKTIRRIGGHREIPIDVRIISATNQDVEELVNSGKFRMDLLYRINIFNIEIPPLRNRMDDIPILTEYFIKKHSKNYKKIVEGIEQKAMKKLVSYNWPGNIRELQNVIERGVALTNDNTIREKDILIDYKIEMNNQLSDGDSLTDIVNNFEREIVLKALKNNRSVRSTAKQLKVTPTLLLNRIKKYEITDGDWRK